jgi:hypothetical protein
MPKSELSWSNISRNDLDTEAQQAWDSYVAAKEKLELNLSRVACEGGAAKEEDTFKFSYMRFAQGTIGMAIDTPSKGQRSGFGGLKRPTDAREVEAEKLAAWRERQASQGRRF